MCAAVAAARAAAVGGLAGGARGLRPLVHAADLLHGDRRRPGFQRRRRSLPARRHPRAQPLHGCPAVSRRGPARLAPVRLCVGRFRPGRSGLRPTLFRSQRQRRSDRRSLHCRRDCGRHAAVQHVGLPPRGSAHRGPRQPAGLFVLLQRALLQLGDSSATPVLR